MARITHLDKMGPLCDCTPTALPSTVRIDFTRSVRTVIPSRFTSRTRPSRMDWALSVTGKTRLPRSVFKAQPWLSKKALVFSGGNAVMALYRNRPFLGVFCRTSSAVQSLVTLHRPLPVISSFLPGRSLRSKTRTFCPRFAAVMAAKRPAGPPPMIIPS